MTKQRNFTRLAWMLGAAGLMAATAHAQPQDKVRIGFVTDMSSL